MDLNTLLTVAGLTPLVSIIVEVVIRALAWTGATKDRFGPLLAIVTAIVVVIPAVLLVGPDGTTVYAAIVSAVIAGAGAMGVHDAVTSANPTG